MSEYLAESAAPGEMESVDNSEIIQNYGKNDRKCLTFWLGKQRFGFFVFNVEQIVRMMPITEVPYYPTYVKGIINLRGAVLPIIDLRVLLGMVDMMDVQDTSQTCIIIVNLGGSQVGFVVDGVDAVLDIPNDAICQPPMMSGKNTNKYLTGIATLEDSDVNNQNVLLIDMRRILQKDEHNMFVLCDA